jgi:hypothetical protein
MTKMPKSWLDGPKIWPSWGGAPKGTRGLQCGGAPTDDDLAELYKALYGYRFGLPLQCVPDQEGRVSMPDTLFVKLCWLVDWHIKQLPWTQEKKDWLRAAMVAQEHAAGKTLEEAYAAVARRLTDGDIKNGIKGTPSPAAARKDMVRTSYRNVIRSLSPEPRPPGRPRKRK